MRLRKLTAAVFVAGGATLGLTGFANAETISPSHSPGGGAVACASPTFAPGPVGGVASAPGRPATFQAVAPKEIVDAKPGWVVDDQGRTLARADWAIDGGGRVMVAQRVVAERGWIVSKPDEVVAARPGDCALTVLKGGTVLQRVQERESHHCTREHDDD